MGSKKEQPYYVDPWDDPDYLLMTGFSLPLARYAVKFAEEGKKKKEEKK